MVPAPEPRQTGGPPFGLGPSRGGDDYSCMPAINDAMAGPIAALVDRGEEHGCLDLSEIDELAQTLDHAALATATTDTLQLFLNEIGRHRLLTPDKEIELARRIEKGDLAAKDRMINA